MLTNQNYVGELTSTAKEMRRALGNASDLMNQVHGDLVNRLEGVLTQSQKTLGAVEKTLANDSPLQSNLQETLAGAGRQSGCWRSHSTSTPSRCCGGRKRSASDLGTFGPGVPWTC